LKFEDQEMTSFGGLVVFQHLFERLGLFAQLSRSCQHLKTKHFYSYATILQCLIVHLLIGSRKLREMDFYRHDPMVLRVAGLKQLPSVATMSRMLSGYDAQTVTELRARNREIVLNRVGAEAFATVTLDFDGSVQSTKRHAEGTAVGFNKQKKGARSYYPLFCTLAQTGQVFDLLHRSGNVHDSKGATAFVRHCVESVRQHLPNVRIEARLDSAFFSDEMVTLLEALGVEYTISVPFERFAILKKVIAERSWWRAVPGSDRKSHFFQWSWKPQSWRKKARFVFIRNTAALQNKAPIQLDLFTPVEHGYEFKAIVTNKTITAGKVARFHEGRGYQEKIYAELKSQAQMDYIPCRRLVANQIYLLTAILAHNLGRELQMQAAPPQRATTQKRTVRWIFEELGTLRRTIIQRAARLTRPQGRWTLTLPNIPALQTAILRLLPA
jgi:hypothetical protein